MRPEELDAQLVSTAGAEVSGGVSNDSASQEISHSGIQVGSRAVNRLLWSLWLPLLPLVWVGNDWMSLLILSQVFLVAARLIQPAATRTGAAASQQPAVLCMQEGGNCAQG